MILYIVSKHGHTVDRLGQRVVGDLDTKPLRDTRYDYFDRDICEMLDAERASSIVGL